jgi:primosomal replication protein N
VPVSEARLGYDGQVTEAGSERRVELEIAIVALGESARQLQSADLGSGLSIEGFLAPKGRNSRQLVLHVNTIEFLEGIGNVQTVRKKEV